MEHVEVMRRFDMVMRCAKTLECQEKMLEDARERGQVVERFGQIELTISCKKLGRGRQKIYLPLNKITEAQGDHDSAAQMMGMIDRGICSLCSVYNGLRKE